MKIRNIYFGKRIPFFCIAVTVLCIAVTLISQLIPSTYGAFRFMYPVKYPWQVFTYIFLQGAPQELLPEGFQYSAMELTIGHLGYNLFAHTAFRHSGREDNRHKEDAYPVCHDMHSGPYCQSDNGCDLHKGWC